MICGHCGEPAPSYAVPGPWERIGVVERHGVRLCARCWPGYVELERRLDRERQAQLEAFVRAAQPEPSDG